MYIEPDTDPDRAASIAVDGDALRSLPARRPADPPAKASRITWSLIAPDRYRVMIAGTTAGYIDVVGAVFVVMQGDPYPRAVEVAQTLVWSTAVAALDQSRS